MNRCWFSQRGDDISRFRRDDIRCGNIRKYSYESLEIATNYFSNKRLIGQGGSASVYRGVLSGRTVAVKKYDLMKTVTPNREQLVRTWEVMSHLRHRNITQLIGFCTDNDSMLLVTEYADNGNLQCFLRRKNPALNWNTIAAICIGIARGFCYLHEDAIPHVLHMDIKPENILVDANFTPKITDFDLAKFFYDPYDSELPRQADCIVGTSGYAAPEYVSQGRYSHKTDVFAFGVVMLEILSGTRVLDPSRKEHHLVEWASKLWNKDRVLKIINPVFTDVAPEMAKSFFRVALLCVQGDPKLRPSMLEALHMLTGVSNSSSLCITNPAYKSPIDVGHHDDHASNDPILWQDGDSSIPQDEGTILLTEAKSAVTSACSSSILQAVGGVDVRGHVGDLITALNNILRIQGVELSIVQQHTNTTLPSVDSSEMEAAPTTEIQAVETGILGSNHRHGNMLSGSAHLVQRQSQTMVFKKITSATDFPEAVYPPFRTRVLRRLGSRNLYSC